MTRLVQKDGNNCITLKSHAFVFEILKTDGDAWFVGGCVRDSLIGKEGDDWDIATTHHPDAVMQMMKQHGITVIPTGIDHGTVTAIIPPNKYEITTLRKDVSTDGRRAVVKFSQDRMDDAARRDFTINSMYMSQDGEIWDPFDGKSDLKAGIVRFIGDPRQRIREDYLRIMRYFRFLAFYGKGEADEKTLDICYSEKNGLSKISSERITHELLRLLDAKNPMVSIEAMVPILVDIVGENINCNGLKKLLEIEAKYGQVTSIARLFRLTNGGTKFPRLCLSKRQKNKLKILDSESMKMETWALFAQHGEESARDIMIMNEMYVDVELLQYQDFPLAGRDVMKMGVLPGPNVGELLSSVREWWLSQKSCPSYDDCIEHAKLVIKNRG